MKNELLPMLVNPYSGIDLKKEKDFLVDVITGEKFAIKNRRC